MVEIIDLAFIDWDGVTFDGGLGTSNNVGIAFQMGLFFCFFVWELRILKVFGTQLIVAQLLYLTVLRSSPLLFCTHFLHLSSSLGNWNIESLQFLLALWQITVALRSFLSKLWDPLYHIKTLNKLNWMEPLISKFDQIFDPIWKKNSVTNVI